MSNTQRLRIWLIDYISRVTGVDASTVSLDRTLADYGLDSVDAVMLAGELEDKFEIEIDPANFMRFTNFEDMVAGLAPSL